MTNIARFRAELLKGLSEMEADCRCGNLDPEAVRKMIDEKFEEALCNQ